MRTGGGRRWRGRLPALSRSGWGFPAGAAGGGGGDPVSVHDRGASTNAALASGGLESGYRPLVGHVPFEFGERGHHGEEELSLACWGVGAGQGAGEDAQTDPTLMQIVGDDQDVFDGAAEPVEFPDRQGVAQVVQRRVQAGTVVAAGRDLLLEDPRASRRDGGRRAVAGCPARRWRPGTDRPGDDRGRRPDCDSGRSGVFQSGEQVGGSVAARDDGCHCGRFDVVLQKCGDAGRAGWFE